MDDKLRHMQTIMINKITPQKIHLKWKNCETAVVCEK